jgi:hypothetical protein
MKVSNRLKHVARMKDSIKTQKGGVARNTHHSVTGRKHIKKVASVTARRTMSAS